MNAPLSQPEGKRPGRPEKQKQKKLKTSEVSGLLLKLVFLLTELLGDPRLNSNAKLLQFPSSAAFFFLENIY